jgi:uncharacterized membrane protein
MRALVNYFLRGLVVVAPLAVTGYVCWRIFQAVDGLLGLPVPGAGAAVTLLSIAAVGFLASTVVARGLFGLVERALTRLPFVRLLYGSTKDLLNAFVGEKRSFDRPVAVTVYPEAGGEAIGFVTQSALDHLGFAGHVAVYLPFSYSVAGHVLVFPADRVRPLAAESADVMAFLVSGGVARATGARPGGARARAAARVPTA